MTTGLPSGWRSRLEQFIQATWRSRGLLSTLLLPLSWLYGALSTRRMARQASRAWHAPVPVIVIGNILVGGTGKTPVAQALCQYLLQAGHQPGLISRGYGSTVEAAPHLSDSRQDSAWLGDEPALLHAATGVPVAVHPQRALAARALLTAHPEIDVLVADDGLQHHALGRDLAIIVQDSRGTGNGRLLPAGPLREPASRLAQADWLLTHLAAGETAPVQTGIPANIPRITMQLQPKHLIQLSTRTRLEWPEWYARHGQQACHAAAGIGRPDRFFAMLRHAGLTLDQTLSSPDHQAPAPDRLQALPPGLILITPKDAIKYTSLDDPRIWVVHPAPQFSDSEWFFKLARQLLPHNSGIRH